MKCDILRECFICNKPIYIKRGQPIPDEIVYIKTKRHNVVLAHKYCVNQEEDDK